MKRIIIPLILALMFTFEQTHCQELKADISTPPLATDTLSLICAESIPFLADTVTLIGVGDIMLGTNFPSPKYLPKDDGWSLMSSLKPILKNANLTFGNLEGPYADSLPITKSCKDTANCYAFRSPDYLFGNIVDAGFDLLSLANNHSGDLGAPGRENTIQLIESSGLYHAGLLESPTAIIEQNGIRYGFCAFSPNKGTCDINDIETARLIVSDLSSNCHITIVSFHGGAEGSKYQHVKREPEIFLGEKRGDVYNFAHRMIDAGADIVWGHGPHVARAIDIYRNRFIIYSMGNFCTYSRIKVSGVNGLAPIIKIYTNHLGEFIKGQIFSAHQIKGVGTRLDPRKGAANKIRQLTKEDFPELNITITDQGEIRHNDR